MTTRREFLTQAAAAGLVATAPSALAAQRTSGTVQTVLGPIDASKLGVTLPHEHLFAGSTGVWQAWPEIFGGREKFIATAVEGLKAVRAGGINTIVDLTTFDLGRDVRLAAEVSRKSGMQIIVCTGHWMDPSRSMQARTVEELTGFFRKEIEQGIEDTGIKAGVIKVATEGMSPFSEKVLRAAAQASKATGVPIETHSLATERDGEKQADIFESEGLSPSKVSIGHSDETDDVDYLLGLLKRGYTVGLDHMTHGAQPSPDPKARSWQVRTDLIKKLIDAGYAKQLFLSNDWMFGISMAPTQVQGMLGKMNPDGMLFNTKHVLPYLKEKGVSEETIRAMTVENPRRFFGGV